MQHTARRGLFNQPDLRLRIERRFFVDRGIHSDYTMGSHYAKEWIICLPDTN